MLVLTRVPGEGILLYTPVGEIYARVFSRSGLSLDLELPGGCTSKPVPSSPPDIDPNLFYAVEILCGEDMILIQVDRADEKAKIKVRITAPRHIEVMREELANSIPRMPQSS